MSESEFPPNSDASRRIQPEDKNIRRVTSTDPIRKKKSIRRLFSETFVAGDAKGTFRYVLMDVVIPGSKDIIFDGVTEGIRKWMFGGSHRRGPTHPQSGATGYIGYDRMARSGVGALRSMMGPQRAMSRQARAAHNFDEIVIEQRVEAEEVIDKLYEVVSRYGSASVADFYELVGLAPNHTDTRWGWSSLQGAGVTRVRGGYMLDLPDPHPLD